MPRSISYDDYLIQSLKDPKEAEAYLNAALEDADPRVFLMALRDVAEARGRRKIIEETVARKLSGKGGINLQSLGALLASLGFRLTVETKDAA